MDYSKLNGILSLISILISVIGIIIVFKIWLKWRYIDLELIQARVFLDRKFLEKNWKYILVIGASVVINQYLIFIKCLGYICGDLKELLSGIIGFIALLFLVVLSYEWFKLICHPPKS